MAQDDRLRRAFDSERERVGWADDVLDIASKLAEGPYRIYGGLLLAVDRVATGHDVALTDESVTNRARYTTVLKELPEIDPLLTDGIEGLIRHAEAHYDYVSRDGGIEIRHLPPKKGLPEEVDFLLFDDLLTSVLNLHEASVAMSLGVALWVWEAGNVRLREHFRYDWLAA